MLIGCLFPYLLLHAFVSYLNTRSLLPFTEKKLDTVLDSNICTAFRLSVADEKEDHLLGYWVAHVKEFCFSTPPLN